MNTSNIQETIRSTILSYAKSLGLNQAFIEEKLKLSLRPGTILSLNKLDKIARLLKVKARSLYKGEIEQLEDNELLQIKLEDTLMSRYVYITDESIRSIAEAIEHFHSRAYDDQCGYIVIKMKKQS